MHDEAQVRFVEAHAQRACGDESLDFVAAQGFFQPLPILRVRPPGVCRHLGPHRTQRLSGVLSGRDRQAVDDSAAGQITQMSHQPRDPLLRSQRGQHPQPQRRTRQRPPDRGDRSPADPQLLLDISHHALVGGGSGRQHRRPLWEVLQQGPDSPVVRPEVVPPVADAVRLVNDQQATSGRQVRQLLRSEPRVVQALGADQQDVDLVGLQRSSHLIPLSSVGRVHRHRTHSRALGGADLVPHQREQRGDDDRRTRAPRAAERSRDKVDGRLAPAGSLHHQRACAPLDQRLNSLELALSEVRLRRSHQDSQGVQRFVSEFGHGDHRRPATRHTRPAVHKPSFGDVIAPPQLP